VSKIEELQDQIQKLSPEEFEQLRNWFWDLDWVARDAQIEADVKSGKLEKISATARRRLRELVDGEVEGVPGALVLDRLRAKLSLSDQERTELDGVLDAYERDRDPGRPAEEVIADIKEKL
jgi:hypothetical protein